MAAKKRREQKAEHERQKDRDDVAHPPHGEDQPEDDEEDRDHGIGDNALG